LTKSSRLAFKIVIKKEKYIKNLMATNWHHPFVAVCCSVAERGAHAPGRSAQWRSGEHTPRGAGLRGLSTHFIQTFKKRVF